MVKIENITENQYGFMLGLIAGGAGLLAHLGFWGAVLPVVLVFLMGLGEYLIMYSNQKPKFKEG